MNVPVRGAVAAGDPATADAVAEILSEGGNAFDAALAALCAAPIAEPVLASLGGGGFLLAQPAGGEPVLYDFFCQTPRVKRPADELQFFEVAADFGTTTQDFHIGMGAVATPGVVAGLFAVHDDLGRLPLSRIVEPATRLARGGTAVSQLQADILGIVEAIYLASDSARALFESRRTPGSVLGAGETYQTDRLADTLDALAREGPDLFYRGEIAAELTAASERLGGMLTMDDLEAYRVARRTPLLHEYAGARIHTNPPPSSGGPLIAFALALLDGQEADNLPAPCGPDDPAWLHRLVDSMELTNLARTRCGLDEGSDDDRVGRLLSGDMIEEYRRAMTDRAVKRGGTTHVSVIDADGNAAALSVSNGEGCGHVLAGCGIMPNNMLGEEDINPSGFHNWAPDTRISSMMAPTIVDAADGSLLALGSGGSNRIRTAILQVLANVLRFDARLPEAIAAPRIHFERGVLNIEAVDADGGFERERINGLTAAFPETMHWATHSMFFGGVHAVAFNPASGQFDGAGDPRRGGTCLIV